MLNIPPTGAEKLGAPGVGALKAVVADAPKLMLGVAEGAVKLNPVAGKFKKIIKHLILINNSIYYG